jgi:hypothetical protein
VRSDWTSPPRRRGEERRGAGVGRRESEERPTKTLASGYKKEVSTFAFCTPVCLELEDEPRGGFGNSHGFLDLFANN